MQPDIYIIYHEDPTGYDSDGINGFAGYALTKEDAEREVQRLNDDEPVCGSCGDRHRRYNWSCVGQVGGAE